MINDRMSGVLMHISSLPGPFSTGVLGKEAINFIDLIKNCGFKCWQVLPLNPVDKFNSPYKSSSAFAGNYIFIDPRKLADMGLVSDDDIHFCLNDNINKVDYDFAKEKTLCLLNKAFNNVNKDLNKQIEQFSINSDWLEPYALFMAIKEIQNFKPWWLWEEKYRNFELCKNESKYFIERINFWKFVQFIYYKQWHEIKNYANKNGISIIGDIPIYVALDSADVWSNTKYFDLNPEDYTPRKVAGVPPDYFSENGQLWGNPLFDWDSLEQDNYSWWIKRFKHLKDSFDIVRIDHFRAFASYWAVPFGSDTAINGQWIDGPREKFFDVLNSTFPDINLIAEDLGFLTDDVRNLLHYTSLPSMKVMEFGFEDMNDNEHLPHNYAENCVAYLGTHDCNTWLGFIKQLENYKRDRAFAYFGCYDNNWDKEGCMNPICLAGIDALLRSRAKIVIITIQDLCGLGENNRMNVPGVEQNNWNFRISNKSLENIDNKYYTSKNKEFIR